MSTVAKLYRESFRWFNELELMTFSTVAHGPDLIKSSSSSSFYLPNNSTMCTSTSTQFRRAGKQGLTRTLTAALNV